jgi:hypothetical protein
MTPTEAAELFRAMADRLERNAATEFGGAFLIIPPEDGGPLDGAFVTTTPNPVVFWSSVQGQVEIAVQRLTAPQQSRGYGR